jgi:hypothetical protein
MDQWDSKITTHASRVSVVRNSDTDYSVKIYSMDGSKDVTWARYVGRTAYTDAMTCRNFLESARQMTRVPIDE